MPRSARHALRATPERVLRNSEEFLVVYKVRNIAEMQGISGTQKIAKRYFRALLH